ncbi:cation diffusion facilitator family transporter [[Eubacterium] hominis]|uniref:cation diffusion facilitator family transporter n=1 Tax=[Eubacterium] hominis TaxID=2764325 RepID=UPI003A4DF60B
MISFLAKKLIKNYKETNREEVRHAYGNLTSTVGVINNIVLFAFKFIAGTLARSVSITADAVNNLSDAGSSIISLVSFKISSKPADEKHPFGHARYECIASMVVATLILILGMELIKTSVDKILHPEMIEFSWLSVVVLVFSISVKLWMYTYNKHYGKLLKSSIMEATAADSISDVMATGAVLLSTIISPLIHFNLDGYMGVIVACFIIFAGLGIIKSALDELLGKAPDEELVKMIQKKVEEYPGALGMHDLVIHDYGSHRTFASLHVEVDHRVDVLKSHDMIDNMEKDFKDQLGIETVIHMDPIVIDDPLTNELREYMKDLVKNIDEHLSMHDFRMVQGTTHSNLIFDVVVPFQVKLSNTQILEEIKQRVTATYPNYFVVVTFDRAYTTQ